MTLFMLNMSSKVEVNTELVISTDITSYATTFT